jgi:heterodisulfide reductase subunit C
MISHVVFGLLLVLAVALFVRSIRYIVRNIRMGKPLSRNDNKAERWKLMGRVAIGQSKMTSRPLSTVLHFFVYVGFIVINIEMLEILIDGLFGTHRVLAFLGGIYPVLISVFEVFAVAVILACVIFLTRRNLARLKRFHNAEMTRWPKSDANIILVTEILLMSAILLMNTADTILASRGYDHYSYAGTYLVSGQMMSWFSGMSDSNLVFLERFGWWFHIIGVFAFLNYIPYSKHMHVFLSFPNVYFSKLGPLARMANMPSITNEIKLMLNPSAEMPVEEAGAEPLQFGAKDATDLSWKALMDAYACTECGRCTSACPANITGKKLSPRKVVMDVRDRIEIIGNRLPLLKAQASSTEDSLLSRITAEELWACTTCNACAQECPVNIDPLAIIMELRRYLVMEKAAAPGELNATFSNIENNGAPWQFSNEDRLQWTGQ